MMRNLDLNRTQTLGLALIVTSLFTYLGGWTWVLAYWDHTYVETYRGFDIYYFPNIGVYGVDIGGEPEHWRFNSYLEGARNMIDDWLDEPIHVEAYRDWDIYQMPGCGLYYAMGPEGTTPNYAAVEDLKAYIDAVYYPTLVYTYHVGSEEWLVYRQGLEELGTLKYWVEYGEERSLEYHTLEAAKAYAEEWIERVTAPASSEEPEVVEEAQAPAEVEAPEQFPEETVPGTIGAILTAQKNVIAVSTGVLGVGLVLLGKGEEGED